MAASVVPGGGRHRAPMSPWEKVELTGHRLWTGVVLVVTAYGAVKRAEGWVDQEVARFDRSASWWVSHPGRAVSRHSWLSSVLRDVEGHRPHHSDGA